MIGASLIEGTCKRRRPTDNYADGGSICLPPTSDINTLSQDTPSMLLLPETYLPQRSCIVPSYRLLGRTKASTRYVLCLSSVVLLFGTSADAIAASRSPVSAPVFSVGQAVPPAPGPATGSTLSSQFTFGSLTPAPGQVSTQASQPVGACGTTTQVTTGGSNSWVQFQGAFSCTRTVQSVVLTFVSGSKSASMLKYPNSPPANESGIYSHRLSSVPGSKGHRWTYMCFSFSIPGTGGSSGCTNGAWV